MPVCSLGLKSVAGSSVLLADEGHGSVHNPAPKRVIVVVYDHQHASFQAPGPWPSDQQAAAICQRQQRGR